MLGYDEESTKAYIGNFVKGKPLGKGQSKIATLKNSNKVIIQ